MQTEAIRISPSERTASGGAARSTDGSFIRMGVLGTAMASAFLMDSDREAGAAMLVAANTTTVQPRGGRPRRRRARAGAAARLHATTRSARSGRR